MIWTNFNVNSKRDVRLPEATINLLSSPIIAHLSFDTSTFYQHVLFAMFLLIQLFMNQHYHLILLLSISMYCMPCFYWFNCLWISIIIWDYVLNCEHHTTVWLDQVWLNIFFLQFQFHKNRIISFCNSNSIKIE